MSNLKHDAKLFLPSWGKIKNKVFTQPAMKFNPRKATMATNFPKLIAFVLPKRKVLQAANYIIYGIWSLWPGGLAAFLSPFIFYCRIWSTKIIFPGLSCQRCCFFKYMILMNGLCKKALTCFLVLALSLKKFSSHSTSNTYIHPSIHPQKPWSTGLNWFSNQTKYFTKKRILKCYFIANHNKSFKITLLYNSCNFVRKNTPWDRIIVNNYLEIYAIKSFERPSPKVDI